MAKKKTMKKTSKKNEVVVQKSCLPTNLDYGEAAGMGYENMSQEDFALPWIQILQALSPEVTGAKEGKKIEGALPGMITDTVSRKLHTSEEGIFFIPCSTDHKWVEWIPRDKGSGFVAQYSLDDPIVLKAKQIGMKNDKGKLLNPDNKNELIETFYCVGLILDAPEDEKPSGYAMIAFPSSKISAYKKGISILHKFKAGVPLFAHRLHLTTVQEVDKKSNPYFNFVINPALGDDNPENIEKNRVESLILNTKGEMNPLIAAGMKLANEFNAGKTKVNYKHQGSGTDSEADNVF